jgi:integrase
MRSLTAVEVGVLMRALHGHRLEPLVVTAIGTGLRQGELLALRWRDLDLEGGTVTVRHTLRRGTRTLGEPKTARARRTVELPASVVAVLAEHKRRRVVRSLDADSDFVFTTAAGRPLDSRNLTQDFQAELEKAKLPRVRWHDLRHTTATLMLEQGEELGIVSRILGHSDFSTTADVYAHLTRKMLGRAASRMEVILGDAVTR